MENEVSNKSVPECFLASTVAEFNGELKWTKQVPWKQKVITITVHNVDIDNNWIITCNSV